MGIMRDMTIVGVPTEIKTDEYRVALTPSGVRELTDRGHDVLVQAGAGEGSAIADDAYAAQGARIVPDAAAVFAGAELIVKVKEPQPDEVARLEPRHTLFTYLHLAAAPELTRGLMDSGATCIAYETVEDARGRLPLLAPMSEVAGKIAAQAGAFMLEKPLGGRGLLLGGVPGVAAGRVMVIGGGVVGQNAAQVALGLGAEVYIFDRSIDRLRELEVLLNQLASTCYSSTLEIEQRLPEVDLVVGAVLVHGAKAPRVITREQLKLMKPGAVLVDVSIDQGGCFETSRPPPTPTRPTRSRGSRTTASRTCPGRSRSPPPTRSRTRRCPTCSSSPARARSARSAPTPASSPDSTSAPARSRTPPWRRSSASSRRRPQSRSRDPRGA